VSEYTFALENFEKTYRELEPLYRQHYGEMQERLAGEGIPIGDFNPQLGLYRDFSRAGWLLNYVVRLDGRAVGYSNIYMTPDMHNGEKIATEDTIYLLPDHRNGTGRKLAQFILEDLDARGVKRLNVTAVTDLRVAKLWKRMGFKETAVAMTYHFEKVN